LAFPPSRSTKSHSTLPACVISIVRLLTRTVVYVTALYLIFQLLTRSDDLEILSHLPPTSSLLAPSHLSLGGSNLHSDMQHHYPGGGLPYPMPPIPPPMPNTPAERSTSLWRIIGGLAFYPFYLLITLLAIPLPMLLNLLHVVLAVVLTVLYPLTSTGTLIFRTFVLAPLGVVRSVINTFWPIIAFVGGVILIGCVMGLIGGWMGRLGLEWVDRRMRRGPARKGNAGKSARSVRGVRSERRARSERDQPSGEERSSREDRSARRAVPETAERFRRSDTVHRSEIQPRSNMDRSSRHHSRTPEDSPSDSGTAHELVTPPRGHGGHNTHSRRSGNDKGKRRADAVEDEDYDHAGYEDAWRGAGRATAREPHVTGTRKRTHMLEAR